MNVKTKNIIYLVLWSISVWGFWYLSISTSTPQFYSPYSLPVVIPTLISLSFFEEKIFSLVLWPSFIAILYLTWSLFLKERTWKIPFRTLTLTIILVLLSFIYLISSWNYALIYQGRTHTIIIYLFSLLFWSLLYYIYQKNKHSPKYQLNYLFHLMLFIWIAYIGFPWLGELL